MEVAGPLGTPLGLAQRKRASPRGEAKIKLFRPLPVCWRVLCPVGRVRSPWIILSCAEPLWPPQWPPRVLMEPGGAGPRRPAMTEQGCCACQAEEQVPRAPIPSQSLALTCFLGTQTGLTSSSAGSGGS